MLIHVNEMQAAVLDGLGYSAEDRALLHGRDRTPGNRGLESGLAKRTLGRLRQTPPVLGRRTAGSDRGFRSERKESDPTRRSNPTPVRLDCGKFWGKEKMNVMYV